MSSIPMSWRCKSCGSATPCGEEACSRCGSTRVRPSFVGLGLDLVLAQQVPDEEEPMTDEEMKAFMDEHLPRDEERPRPSRGLAAGFLRASCGAFVAVLTAAVYVVGSLLGAILILGFIKKLTSRSA